MQQRARLRADEALGLRLHGRVLVRVPAEHVVEEQEEVAVGREALRGGREVVGGSEAEGGGRRVGGEEGEVVGCGCGAGGEGVLAAHVLAGDCHWHWGNWEKRTMWWLLGSFV